MQASTVTVRPHSRVAGYHKWRDLLFLHWRVPPEDVQPLLPAGLSVETFDGWAWVGLVAFDMLGVRPWWFPPLPGVSAFHETNVRTYVTRDGDDRGVWFFSLDAANSLAVRIARRRWHLNYYRADLRMARHAERIAYTGRRLWPGDSEAAYTIEAEIPKQQPDLPAAAGSLEQFLVERYVMYTHKLNSGVHTAGPNGLLFRGEVRHIPYPLRAVRVTGCSQSLLAAAGIAASGPPDHALFSPGVDVTILGLLPVDQ